MSAFIISPEAYQDLQDIWTYIASDSETAAERLEAKFFLLFAQLAKRPGQGHSRSDITPQDVLFWPVDRYLIVYRAQKPLQIVAVLHGARDITAVLGER